MKHKNKILLIDHSDDSLNSLSTTLKNKLDNIEIFACLNADEALPLITRYRFDIVTIFIDLPDTNNSQLIEKIRNSSKNKDSAIFAVSNNKATLQSKTATAYFDTSDEHQSLVPFISNFLQHQEISTARILYIDDSPTSSAFTSALFKKLSFDFQHFSSSEKGLEHLKQDIKLHGHCRYDLLISTLILSSTRSGYDLVKSVRNEHQLDYLSLPILLLTSEPEEGEKIDFTGIFGVGTNDFLTKPFSEDNLLERTHALINLKRQHLALSY